MRRSDRIPNVVGVDTGSRWVGLVACQGRRVLAAATLDLGADQRGHDATVRPEDYDQLYAAVGKLMDAAQLPYQIDVAGVEQINRPKGHARGRRGHLIQPWPLMRAAALAATAHTLLTSIADDVVLVPPRGNGDAPLEAYRMVAGGAAWLVGPRERTGGGKSPYQHRRSAYDVAQAAVLAHRRRVAA